MAFNLTFDIVKFSEALSPSGSAAIQWTHTTGRNLQLVLEGSDSRYNNATLRLDAFQGTTLLERVNVAEYIDASIRTRRMNVGARMEDLQIFGITKDPTLALRYQLDGKSRRLQMRLKSSEDFQEIMGILSKRGMEFSEQRPNTGRPNTSSSRPSTMQHSGRPLATPVAQAAHQEQSSSRPRPSPFHIPDMEAGSLSQRPSTNAIPTTHRAGQLTAPRESSFRSSSAQPRHSQVSESLQPAPFNDEHVSETHPNVTLATRDLNGKTAQSTAGDFFQFSDASPEIDRGALKLQPQQGWSSGGLLSRVSAVSSDSIDPRPSTALSVTSASSIFPDLLEHEIPPERALPFKVTGSSRPSSSAVSIPSAASLIMPNTLEHEIPPRRDLPFKVRGGRGNGNGGTSRPGSALPPPPSKKAKMSKERPKTASAAQEHQSEVKARRSRPDDASEPMKVRRLPVQSNISFTASKSAPKESEDDVEEPVPMKDLIFGSRSINPRLRVSSTMDAPHESESPPCSPAHQDPLAPSRAGQFSAAPKSVSIEHNILETETGNVASSANRSNEMTLDQYTSQTPEARQMALDQFMIDNLQNPSFTTLCEDVERCWRRIALGL